MIDLKIDAKDLADEFSLTRSQVDDMLETVVDVVASQFERKWRQEAGRRLGQSKAVYLRSIDSIKLGRFTRSVFLDPNEWLPNAIEEGASPFDMKPGFLRSSKVKYTKKGKPYLTIPFRFGTPGIIGENEIFAGIMPQQILSGIKKSERDNPEAQDKLGLPLSSIPEQYKIPESAQLRARLKATGVIAETNFKKTSIYQGLKRNERGSGYVNFRRVSENSDKLRFQHPGIEARNLMRDAEQRLDVPFEVDVAVDNFLVSLGFG